MNFRSSMGDSYFGVCFDNGLSSSPVRFLCISPEEVMLFDLEGRWGVLLFGSQSRGAFALHGAGCSDCGGRARHCVEQICPLPNSMNSRVTKSCRVIVRFHKAFLQISGVH